MAMKTAVLFIGAGGTATGLYSDVLPQLGLGLAKVRRASNIEFNNRRKRWEVTIKGRVVHHAATHGECLDWEVETLNSQLERSVK